MLTATETGGDRASHHVLFMASVEPLLNDNRLAHLSDKYAYKKFSINLYCIIKVACASLLACHCASNGKICRIVIAFILSRRDIEG